jgi:hypothetical protein
MSKQKSEIEIPFWGYKSISTGAHYVTLDNKIKCLRLAVFLGQPHQKTVTGAA